MKTETVAKHTPGPWEINMELIKSAIGFDRVVFYSIREPYGSQHINSEHHANARLIAAAPDLLEAAKAILSSVVWDDKKDCAMLAPDGKTVNLLRVAVAKAEG